MRGAAVGIGRPRNFRRRRLTRRVSWAQLTWFPPDSGALVATYDSVARALEARGGRHVVCEPLPDDGRPLGREFERWDAWRFSSDEVRVLGGPVWHSWNATQTGWFISVVSVPRGTPGCAIDHRRVLLPPSEWPRAARQWLEDQGLL